MRIILLLTLISICACTKHGFEINAFCGQAGLCSYQCMEVFPIKTSNILAIYTSMEEANQFCEEKRKEKGL